jgi:hypothetical protein
MNLPEILFLQQADRKRLPFRRAYYRTLDAADALRQVLPGVPLYRRPISRTRECTFSQLLADLRGWNGWSRATDKTAKLP